MHFRCLYRCTVQVFAAGAITWWMRKAWNTEDVDLGHKLQRLTRNKFTHD